MQLDARIPSGRGSEWWIESEAIGKFYRRLGTQVSGRLAPFLPDSDRLPLALGKIPRFST
jgi:hypothetical protein